jgi:hypothetical protein
MCRCYGIRISQSCCAPQKADCAVFAFLLTRRACGRMWAENYVISAARWATTSRRTRMLQAAAPLKLQHRPQRKFHVLPGHTRQLADTAVFSPLIQSYNM